MKDSYVYEPSEDSFLLKQTIEKLSQYNTALEIGIGSGVISKEIVLHTKTFYGIDKNPYAIEETKETISEYLKIHKNRSHKTKIILKQGDMFKPIKNKKFDLIVCNPPYLPAHKTDEGCFETMAITGGKKGYEFMLTFIEQLPKHLTQKGESYILLSNLTRPHIIKQKAEEMLLTWEIVSKKVFLGETLYVIKLTKKKILQKLHEKKITKLQYIAKGKRSVVYKGRYKRKNVAIKIITNEDTPHALEKEIENALFVNKKNIGPKIYYPKNYTKNHDTINETNDSKKHYNDNKEKPSFVIMEYLEGKTITEFLETEENRKKIKKVLQNILKQCYTMDTMHFNKKELTNPYKHIIVSKNKATMIDFERGTISEKTKNVTQFLEYIERHKKLQEKNITIKNYRTLSKVYKNNPSKANFKKIRDAL